MMVNNETLIGTVTPTVYVDKITLESGSDDNLKVSLDLVVKDILDSNLMSSWFNQLDFTKMVKIRVIQVDDERLFNVLSNREKNASVNLIRNSSLIQQLVHRDIDLMAAEESNSGFSSKRRTTDNNGNIVTDFNYRFQFDIEDKSLDHLSYFCFSYVDPMELENYLNTSIPDNMSEIIGKVSTEVVLNKGEIVSHAFAFTDKNGDIWPGPVHRMPNGQWMTGSKHSNNDRNLNRIKIPNTKIQDFRILARMTDMQVDLSEMKNEFFDPSKPKILRNDSTDVSKNPGVFTNAWTSRDENNNCNFVFGVDTMEMVKTNSKFGSFLSNVTPKDLQTIANLSTIKDIKLYRKRVKNNLNINLLGTLESPTERFDDVLESDTLLAISGDKNGNFLSVIGDDYSLSEIQLDTPVNMNEAGNCRYFSVSDKKLKDLTYGLYQYGVEIKLNDGIQLHLQNTLSLLKRTRKNVNSYLMMAGMNYDRVSRKFYSSFVTEQESKFGKAGSSPWIEPVVQFSEALMLITGDRTVKDKAQHISGMISPSNGTLEALELFALQFDKLLVSLENLVGAATDSKDPNRSKQTYSHGSSNAFYTIEEQQWLKNSLVDAENYSNSGIAYFPLKDTNAFRQVSYEEFMERQAFDREKGRKVPQITNVLNSLSVLSPSYVKVDGSVSGEAEDVLNYNFPNILSDIGVSVEKISKPKLVPLVLQQTSGEQIFSVNNPSSIIRNIDFEIEPLNEQPAAPFEAQVALENKFKSDFLVQLVEGPSPQASFAPPSPPRLETAARMDELEQDGMIAPNLETVDLSWVYDIDWSLIKRIDVLTGYETDTDNKKMLKGEKWQPLTEQLYADEQYREKMLLCRMVPFSSEENGIKYNNNLELPTYNKYFILQGAPKVNIEASQLIATTPTQQMTTNYFVASSVENVFMTTAYSIIGGDE